jgi:hypothetical protein
VGAVAAPIPSAFPLDARTVPEYRATGKPLRLVSSSISGSAVISSVTLRIIKLKCRSKAIIRPIKKPRTL